jgi:hypothetical protein
MVIPTIPMGGGGGGVIYINKKIKKNFGERKGRKKPGQHPRRLIHRFILYNPHPDSTDTKQTITGFRGKFQNMYKKHTVGFNLQYILITPSNSKSQIYQHRPF